MFSVFSLHPSPPRGRPTFEPHPPLQYQLYCSISWFPLLKHGYPPASGGSQLCKYWPKPISRFQRNLTQGRANGSVEISMEILPACGIKYKILHEIWTGSKGDTKIVSSPCLWWSVQSTQYKGCWGQPCDTSCLTRLLAAWAFIWSPKNSTLCFPSLLSSYFN